MKKSLLLALITIPLLLSACNRDSKPTDGSGNPTNGQSIFEVPANILTVTPSVAEELQVESLIPVSGGTLTVTGGDGTTYTLMIPANALTIDTTIRMIPVDELNGMPFGNNPLAVQLEPNGLQFDKFVTLTITPAQPIPAEEQILFGYQGEANHLVLAAPIVSSTDIQILMDHFSGYGVTKGLLADIEPVRQRIGGDAEARIRSQIAESLQRERQRQLLGGEPDNSLWESFDPLFKEYEEQVIKPRIAAAGESCAAGRLAMQTVLGYERQRQLLGISEGSSNLFDAGLMGTVATICMQEEYELCRDDHVIHRIIPAWLGLERQYALLGMGEENPQVLQTARGLVEKCLSFELVFESEASFDDGGGGGYSSSVTSTVKTQFSMDEMNIKGTAPLVNTRFEFRTDGCDVENIRGGDTFTLISLIPIPQSNIPEESLGSVVDIKMTYFPGNTSESFTITCEDTPPFTSPPTPLWTGIYLITHQAEMDMTGGGFLVEGWEIFGDEFFAKKEWILESASDGVVEAGTFKLYHRPK